MRRTLLAALLAAAACAPSQEQQACASLRDRIQTCFGDKWPAQVAADVHLHCLVAMRHQPEPNESPRNLAALDKQVFQDCSAKTTCGDLSACFETHGCKLLFTSPTDTRPQLQCWMK